jgi:hypothetical protein
MNATALSVDPLALTDLVPPATLPEARAFRDDLTRLLRRERAAAADVLVALADFDRRRAWERLGHASLFAFLTRELGRSNGAAFLRVSAARLLPRFPEVEAALREGKLCLSAVGELSRVLTEQNRAEVLPRFFGRSSREAREVAAALAPRAEVPRREVVTVLPARPAPAVESASPPSVPGPALTLEAAAAPQAASLRAREVGPTHPARALPRDEAEPLDADLRRLHVTVSRRLLEKLDRARDGLSHALPGATAEQVLEAALDLLLEQQARAKALVKRPRPARAPRPAAADPRAIPAAVEREVRLRDEDRCQFPLDAGGVCGSRWQVELDHITPLALGGESTVANLRCACRRHNLLAAARALGERARPPASRRPALGPGAPGEAALPHVERQRRAPGAGRPGPAPSGHSDAAPCGAVCYSE